LFTDALLKAMFYNNLLSIPVLFASSLLFEDWSLKNINMNFPEDRRGNIIIAMIFSGLSSIFISYTSAWCVRTTSSTTYSMVGALNKLPLAISGLIFFDAPVTFFSVTVRIAQFLLLTTLLTKRWIGHWYRFLFRNRLRSCQGEAITT
jgi:GDP-mannose transporter